MGKSSVSIYIHSVFLGIRKQGVVETISMIVIALLDLFEDKLKGIKAHEFVDTKAVKKEHESAPFANFYQPVRSIPFRLLLKKLNLTPTGSFVDIGAGTGKAMLLAYDYGFKKVRGIELVEELVVLAELNRITKGLSVDSYECIVGDALNFEFRADDQIYFFNDPFSDEVFSKILQKLMTFSLEKNLSPFIIYKNNSRRDISSFKKLAQLGDYKNINIMGNNFEIISFLDKEIKLLPDRWPDH